MFRARSGLTHEQLLADFRWTDHLPQQLNIGHICCDAQPRSANALLEVRPDGHIRQWSFGELADQSSRFANGLLGLGVTRGERVALVLPQGPEAAIAQLATYKLGAVAVPMTQLFGPDALAYRLADSAARVVVTDGNAFDKVVTVADELGDVQVVVAAERVAAPHRRFADLLSGGSADLPTQETGLNDPALMIYTSGTTGPPKGALHAHRVLLGHLPGFELMFNFFPQPDDRMWTPADWAWIGGLLDAVLPSWYHGRPVVAAPRSSFDPDWAMDLIRRCRITASFQPPAALKLMRQARTDGRGAGLRTVMSGGEPLGAEMLAWGREHLGVTINEVYGQTEANLLIGNCSAVWDPVPGSMGLPYPGHKLGILADGAIAGPGVEGEIVVHASDPVMLLEYWGMPEATKEKFTTVDGERWLLTGDVGTRDEDGRYWFAARADDVIISAGYRIGPSEIEECLMSHPLVAMVGVIGVPDEVRTSIVKAFVVTRGVEPSDELRADLQRHVRERLAAYEYPREIEFVSMLPLTTTGKIRRQELRDREMQRLSLGTES